MSVSNIINPSTGKIDPSFIPPVPFKGIGSYYKSSNQLAFSGTTAITWDLSEDWTENGFIDPTSSTNFVVNTAGVYQLTAHITITANGQTWTSGGTKSTSITITRPPSGSQNIFVGQSYPLSGSQYSTDTTGTMRLQVGDIIQITHINTLTSVGQYSITGNVAPLDRNAIFQFQLI